MSPPIRPDHRSPTGRTATSYEIELDGEPVGLLSYRLAGDMITHRHTEIDPSVGGRGLGSALVRFALDDARARGLTRDPGSARSWRTFIVRHPEYEDLCGVVTFAGSGTCALRPVRTARGCPAS